mmetsp:Transcript_47890/g.40519  ORF Transcript_47890/g.40519 Transcript_47890/m.40519 type:complete len:122 (-) Transcript_47890:449-814(-)
MHCWGDNTYNQSTVDFPSDLLGNRIHWKTVSTGFHTCGTNTDLKLVCWGLDNNKQTVIPKEFEGGVIKVSVGLNHTCAIKVYGVTGCWGLNDHGQTNVTSFLSRDAYQVSAGNLHSCGIAL